MFLFWGVEPSVAWTVWRPSWRSWDKYFSTFDQKTKRFFNCKILPFLLDRDPHRYPDADLHLPKILDTDPHWNPCGSITLLKYNGKILFHYSQPTVIREFMTGSPLTNVRTMYKIVHIYEYVLTVCILITKMTVWSKPILRVRIRKDPHHFGKLDLDPNPHQSSQKPDPNLWRLKIKPWGTVDAPYGKVNG